MIIPSLSRRLSQRLLTHHVTLAGISVASVAALYFTRSYDDIPSKLSFATAYPALALLAATLLIGPFNLLRGKRMPISSDLRRDVGIWAGILGLAHAVIGQNVHLRGRPWLYYVYGPKEAHVFPLRYDLFGLANYTGLVATLVVLLLLATSNDYALRVMSTPGWKNLQRWNYLAFALTGVHALAYQKIETQEMAFVLTVIISLVITVVFQMLGFWRRAFGKAKKQLTQFVNR